MKRISRRMFIFVPVALCVLILGTFFYLEEQGNFHPITPGEAYRSGQLDRDELEYYGRNYHLKSILNLRGRNPDDKWYTQELQVSSKNGIKHYDLALSATRELTPEEVRMLTEIFNSAPRPILVHCKSGADRSGLVAAMWKVIVDKRPKDEAKKQLSIIYGHIPVGPTTAMDRFFETWQPGR